MNYSMVTVPAEPDKRKPSSLVEVPPPMSDDCCRSALNALQCPVLLPVVSIALDR
jgi:hypothetical protein